MRKWTCTGIWFGTAQCRIVLGIVTGLAQSHASGVAHLDVKLENVLLGSDGNVKLADYGLSRTMRNGALPRLSQDWGKRGYQAPEVVSGDRVCGPAADVWSLGIVLYVLLCEKFPFERSLSNGEGFFKQLSAGTFQYPHCVQPVCLELLNSMLVGEPYNRATLAEVTHRLQDVIQSMNVSRLLLSEQLSMTDNSSWVFDSFVSPTNVQDVSSIEIPLAIEGHICNNQDRGRGTHKMEINLESKVPPGFQNFTSSSRIRNSFAQVSHSEQNHSTGPSIREDRVRERSESGIVYSPIPSTVAALLVGVENSTDSLRCESTHMRKSVVETPSRIAWHIPPWPPAAVGAPVDEVRLDASPYTIWQLAQKICFHPERRRETEGLADIHDLWLERGGPKD